MSINLDPTTRAQLNVEHGTEAPTLDESIGEFETITAKLTKNEAFVPIKEHAVKRGHDPKMAIISRRLSLAHDKYLIWKIGGKYRVDGPGVSFTDRSITRIRKVCDLMAQENYLYTKEKRG